MAAMMKRALAVIAAVALAAATPAWAHTSYLMPNVFATIEGETVTVQSAFSDDFPRPEIAVDAQDFHMLLPDGKKAGFDKVVQLRQVTVLEGKLPQSGTYRFTTGERLGRSGQMVRENGVWRPLSPGEPAPAGTQARDSQTATVAEVYVTKGAPTRQAVDAPQGRLAFKLVTHPSEAYLGEDFVFRVLFDGAPLKGQEIEVTRDGGGYEEPKYARILKADADGKVVLKADRPGVYLFMTRHGADAPAGAATPMRSYTTSLTLEVSR